MRGSRRWWVVIGGAAMIVATGCARQAGSGDEAGVGRPEVETFSTHGTPLVTTAPAAEPQAPQPSARDTTVARPPVADLKVVRAPVYVNGVPQVVATPSRAPAGARVTLDGIGFTDDMWAAGGGNLWLSIDGGQSSCYLMASAVHDVEVDETGHLTGGFTVPDTGVCRFTAGDEMSTAGFDFHIAFQCTPCFIGRFSVPPAGPAPEPTGTHCGTLAFPHGPVESGELYADGLTCEETRLVVDDASTWAPVTGPPHVDAAGFSCDRVGQAPEPPRATYRCTQGAQSVWFVSTGRS